MAVSLATNIIIISGVFTALPVIAVALRFYARHLKNVGISADDYLIVPGLVCQTRLRHPVAHESSSANRT